MTYRDKDEVERSLDILRNVLHETRGMDRRGFLKVLGKAAVATPLVAGVHSMAMSTARASGPITTMGYGGSWQDAMQKAYLDPWSEKTGESYNYVTPMQFARVIAMDQAKRQQIDVMEAGALESMRMLKLGLNAEMDWNVIDKSALTPNQLKYPNAISSITLSTLMVYSKAKWPGDDHPKSWADFWDVEKFPGRRAMFRRPYSTLEAALIADGMPLDPEKMYPLDLDRAFAKLDEIKPHVNFWWNSGSETQQLIQDNEVDLCVIWSGRAVQSIKDNGANFGIVWNQATYNSDYELWFALRNSPNPEGAMQLLDIVGRAEPQAVFARATYYGPTNLKAYDYLDDSIGPFLPSYPDNSKLAFPINYQWWSEHQAEIFERFEAWLQS
ncbi:ABC transporter substrate-binding protein [Acuticoccus mangrovi]|uniref:ABC transporter substrate-binding protein n=1 Tax=Acuticoccus mangrovi TaxID=2796142 RepID=A0A934ISK9_9HYPH|nr:ABC transporter substrate-binding protein [Acuticoccus mangrovi]MBJ3777863.1 ABC transporter substrate-binding protein [Acuticoccus mangrovi]